MKTTLHNTSYHVDGTARWTYRTTHGTPVTVETVLPFGALVTPAPTWLTPGAPFDSFLPSL